MSDISEGATLKRWFDAKGWESSSQQGLFTLGIKNLASWEPPEGLLTGLQRYSFSFDLIHGRENADGVIEHVGLNASSEVQQLYLLALEDAKACGVVRAKSPIDGSLVGTIIITRSESVLARYIPTLSRGGKEVVGGIIAPVVPRDQQQAHIILQGLVLLGLRQNKAHGTGSTVLNWVKSEERDVLLNMGFDVLGAFEELSMAADDMIFS